MLAAWICMYELVFRLRCCLQLFQSRLSFCYLICSLLKVHWERFTIWSIN